MRGGGGGGGWFLTVVVVRGGGGGGGGLVVVVVGGGGGTVSTVVVVSSGIWLCNAVSSTAWGAVEIGETRQRVTGVSGTSNVTSGVDAGCVGVSSLVVLGCGAGAGWTGRYHASASGDSALGELLGGTPVPATLMFVLASERDRMMAIAHMTTRTQPNAVTTVCRCDRCWRRSSPTVVAYS